LDYARALAATGAVDQARGQLLEALRLAPDLEQAHYHLAILQTQAGELADALRSYEASLQLAPTAWPARIGRAWVLVRLQREAEAAEELARVIAQRPQERGLRLDYARLLRGLSRNAEALTQLREAVALDPKDLGASAWLAWELAVQADDALRDGARALQLAEALVASSAQRNADHLEILAAALAETGRAQEAAQAQRQALAVAPSDLDPRLREAWTARVELYARGGKHREP
jgi:tetratricopeptide (TPR) repeat protein